MIRYYDFKIDAADKDSICVFLKNNKINYKMLKVNKYCYDFTIKLDIPSNKKVFVECAVGQKLRRI